MCAAELSKILKIFVFGLDYAGKTSLVHFLRTGQLLQIPRPTKTFDISNLLLDNIDFRIWDAPGQIRYHEMWGKGLDSVNIMVFVLDTATNNRYMEAKKVLLSILGDPLTYDIPLVFCYHKMDLPAASANYSDATEFFRLHAIKGRDVFTYFTSIKENIGREKIKRKLVEIVENLVQKT